MCKRCAFALWSGPIRVKSEKPEGEKKAILGVKVVLIFGLGVLPEMQRVIDTSTESV